MARMKSQLVKDPDTGKLVQVEVEMTTAEEAKLDAEEADWTADTDNREREQKIDDEVEAIAVAEQETVYQTRRTAAITALQDRGEIT